MVQFSMFNFERRLSAFSFFFFFFLFFFYTSTKLSTELNLKVNVYQCFTYRPATRGMPGWGRTTPHQAWEDETDDITKRLLKAKKQQEQQDKIRVGRKNWLLHIY